MMGRCITKPDRLAVRSVSMTGLRPMRLVFVALVLPTVLAVVLAVVLAGCAEGVRAQGPRSASGASPTAVVMDGAPGEALAWSEYGKEAFDRAKRENKLVLLDGAAEWCHWCHVMEATSYHDARVRKILDESFITIKVDVDARPDLEERYGDWGWPATIVFSPGAEEIAKYKGYIAPDDFVHLLEEVVRANRESHEKKSAPEIVRTRLSPDAFAYAARDTEARLASYWDDDEGGWGRMQKAPIGGNNAWLLHRARAGDAGSAEARKNAELVLHKQAKIIDPVWGGIYQYSAASDWDHPHFEKLATFQAPAIENYAEAFALTKDVFYKDRALAVRDYVKNHLTRADGGFYTTQDADLNAHDRAHPFMSGHDFYARDDAQRRSVGEPRVDTHVYARENGLLIAAHVSLYEGTNDPTALAAALAAANSVYATHATSSGAVAHDAEPRAKVLFLADNAAFGLACVRLHAATRDPVHLERARKIAAFIESELAAPQNAGLFASTKDPDASGVFATRRLPFEHEIVALRFFARLAEQDPAWAATHACFVADVMSAVTTPEDIHGQGRWLGDYLLAESETRSLRSRCR